MSSIKERMTERRTQFFSEGLGRAAPLPSIRLELEMEVLIESIAAELESMETRLRVLEKSEAQRQPMGGWGPRGPTFG